jgi:hypothetical protein
MKKLFFDSKLSLSVCVCLFFLVLACTATKYVSPPNAYEIQKNREEIIEKDLSSVFEPALLYRQISFSKSVVMRPNSFFALDSLYALKLKNENNRTTDPILEQAIENQRIVASKDKNQIRAKVEHLFQLINNSTKTAEYCNSYYVFGERDSIVESKITERFVMKTGLGASFENYMKEISITGLGAASQTEQDFYKMYKKKVKSLKGDDQDKFLEHTLTLMNALNKAYVRSLHINYMITPWLTVVFDTKYDANGFLELEDLQENFETKDGVDFSTGYTATVKYDYKSTSWNKLRFNVKLDPYLQVMTINEITL